MPTSNPRLQSFYNIQSGKIEFSAETIISATNDIVPFLNSYAVLYYGHFREQIYIDKFLQVRNQVVQQLIDLPVCKSCQWSDYFFENRVSYGNAAFIMYMCRLAQETVWNFPALCNYGKWVNGGSRTMATGMYKRDPWNSVLGLELVELGQSSTMLCDPKEITSTEMLHNVLQLDSDPHDPAKVKLTTELKNSKIYFLSIEDKFNKFDNFSNINGYNIWDSYATWRGQYPTRPKIKIYTNWPEQIHNYFNTWDIVEILPSQHIIDEIQGFGGRTGRLERFAIEEHNHPKETVDHVLYVIDPRPVELGDFLIWMDAEHSTYIESEWKFLLYKKADVYKNTYINTSYIMQ